MLRKLIKDKVLSKEEMSVCISLTLKSLVVQFIAVDIVKKEFLRTISYPLKLMKPVEFVLRLIVKFCTELHLELRYGHMAIFFFHLIPFATSTTFQDYYTV